MDAGSEAHLAVEGVRVDGRDAALLRAVAEHGSLNAAADALGRSYSRAHGRIDELEAALGPLVERERGGSGGGGSRLTDAGRELLARFDRLAAALDGTVVDREGDLVTVETGAGRVRALALTDAERVQVSFRADAVTLHRPAGAPERAATSARNRFGGVVTGVDRAAATATVSVDVGVDSPLAVRVTTESLDRLDLTVGDDVVATVKATATRATPASVGDDG